MSKKIAYSIRGLALAALALSLTACVDPSTFTGNANSNGVSATNLNNAGSSSGSATSGLSSLIPSVSSLIPGSNSTSNSSNKVNIIDSAKSALVDSKAAIVDQVQNLVSKSSVTNPADQNLLSSLANNKYLNSQQLTNLLDTTDNQYVKNSILLKLTDKLIGENKLDAAQYYLGQFVKSADAQQNNDYSFLASKVGSLVGDTRLSSSTNDVDLDKLAPNQVYQALQLQLTNNMQAQNYDQALNFVNHGYSKLSATDKKNLVDLTLKKLMQIPEDRLPDLAQDAATAGNSLNIGWYRLAQLAQANKDDPTRLNDVWSVWYNAFKPINHPAALTAPSMFRQTALVSNETLKNITVLLPLTDATYKDYAQAVKEGFEQANRDSNVNATLNFVDTTTTSMNDALAQAYQNNSDLVVGPLKTDNVRAASGFNLQRPQLMLNYNGSNPNINACYVSQKIEYESLRGVKLFNQLKVKNPIIIVANGSSSYTRAKDQFLKSWLQQKEQNLKVYGFANVDSLNTLASNLSHQSPAVDAVAFFGDAQSLVKFKQFWNITTDRNITIFATSASNSVLLSKSKLADLNGVYFTENALVAQGDSPLAQQANKTVKGNFNLLRLYGYGYDAFAISQNFASFQKVSGYSLKNKTSGSIIRSQGNTCTLIAEPDVYRIVNGVFTKQ